MPRGSGYGQPASKTVRLLCGEAIAKHTSQNSILFIKVSTKRLQGLQLCKTPRWIIFRGPHVGLPLFRVAENLPARVLSKVELGGAFDYVLMQVVIQSLPMKGLLQKRALGK